MNETTSKQRPNGTVKEIDEEEARKRYTKDPAARDEMIRQLYEWYLAEKEELARSKDQKKKGSVPEAEQT
jgi:hypothetical protein